MSEGLNEECGLIGIFGLEEASQYAFRGLRALQHRGQESAGISASDEITIRNHVAMGLAHQIFNKQILESLPGSKSIGHNRYSTSGQSALCNAQPLLLRTRFGQLAIAMNGTIVNAPELTAELTQGGAIFVSSTDTEILAHLVSRSHQPDFETALIESLGRLQGAFCFLILREKTLVAVRDPAGYRPLSLGHLNGATVVASETCAFYAPGIKAAYEREIEPGEILFCSPSGRTSLRPFPPATRSECVFEHVYFSRPNYPVFGREPAKTRLALGRILGRESPITDAIIVPVPDSGLFAAQGFAEAAGLPLCFGLTRDHYVGRTFIEPRQTDRENDVEVKLCPVPFLIRGKRVVLVDDSIVRGTTCRRIVRMVRTAGAAEVHLRISSPPYKYPCFYGVDTPNRAKLAASSMTVEEVRQFVEADGLAYISLPGLKEACNEPTDGTSLHCFSCFDGNYNAAADLIQLRLDHPPAKL